MTIEEQQKRDYKDKLKLNVKEKEGLQIRVDQILVIVLEQVPLVEDRDQVVIQLHLDTVEEEDMMQVVEKALDMVWLMVVEYHI